jgi:hypothetical protein
VNGPFLTTHTDEQGRFQVQVEASPWQETVAWACVRAPRLAVGGDVLRRGENYIRLGFPKRIGGTVTDTFGHPVARTKVALSGVDQGQPRGFLLMGAIAEEFTAVTDAKGHWTMADVPPSGAAVLITRDPRFLGDQTPVDLGKSPNDSIALVALPGMSIAGRVVYDNGTPAEGVGVFAQAQDQELERSGPAGSYAYDVTGQDGRYRLPGLPDGVYNLMVDDPSGEWIAAAREGVTVTTPMSSSLPDLVLTHGAVIEGQVFDTVSGQPLAGVSVGSYGPHRPRSSAAIVGGRADVNGRYRIRVAPGESYVYVSGPPPGHANPGNTVQIAEGETATLDFAVGPESKQRRTWWPF